MKAIQVTALAAALTLLSACIPSLNPFYTEGDLVSEPGLAGQWEAKDKNELQTWDFQPAGRAYTLSVTDKDGKRGKFTAHLFKLKDQRFLDIIPAECDFAPDQSELVAFSMMPGHLLIRVAQIEPELKLAFVDYQWLEKHLKNDPKALAHHREDDHLVLTATTRDLQRFVLRHGPDGGLFQEPFDLLRCNR